MLKSFGWTQNTFIKAMHPLSDTIATKLAEVRNGVYATTVIDGLRIVFPRTTLMGTKRVPIENQTIRIKGMELW